MPVMSPSRRQQYIFYSIFQTAVAQGIGEVIPGLLGTRVVRSILGLSPRPGRHSATRESGSEGRTEPGRKQDTEKWDWPEYTHASWGGGGAVGWGCLMFTLGSL